MKTEPLLTEFFQCLVCIFRCNYIKKHCNTVMRWLRKDTMKLCSDEDGAEPVVFSSDIQSNAREQFCLLSQLRHYRPSFGNNNAKKNICLINTLCLDLKMLNNKRNIAFVVFVFSLSIRSCFVLLY